MRFSYEQGPIRPPSEAKSLLIRVTRNCPWNKCAFCHTYRDTKFQIRSVQDVKADIQKAKDIADQIKEISWKIGQEGRINEFVVNYIYQNDGFYNDSFKGIAAWLFFGGKSVFLQDADTIIIKTDDLVEIVLFIKEQFPDVDRITSYCRSKTACRKSVEDFKSLYNAGLSRIHVGMESGYDPVLKFIKKGVTAAEHVEGGRKIVESGISLSEYIIPGLGGDKWSKEHAVETAKVLNQINPDFIRLRSLQVRRNTELYKMREEGKFKSLGDEDVVREIRLFVESLEGIESRVVSDHILNLLEELEGKLPVDKEKLLGIIDRYFALPDDDRIIYRLGRRRGIYRRLDDLSDTRVHNMLKSIIDEYKSKDIGKLDRDLYRIMHHYI
ncbi:MAG: radical SAM protein [Planctomycetaceae bacterium]|nr:MAG: radical SAM protein [Planctomycetaceae bacterium]